jgi:hypothetical protein
MKKQSIIEMFVKYELKFVSVFHKAGMEITHGFMTKMGSFCDKNRR